MYAQIIPLVRMPRRFACFDYSIPEQLNVQIGDLVIAPLKGRPVAGIVRGMTPNSEFDQIRSIENVIVSKFMTPADIERLELIANQILQSPATVFSSALQGITHSRSTAQEKPKVRSGSIDKQTASTIQSALATRPSPLLKGELEGVQNRSNNSRSIETSLEGSITAIRFIIQRMNPKATPSTSPLGSGRTLRNQTLILCPRERDVDIISEFIPTPHAKLHGHTSIAKRKWILENWRSGDLKVLIGTRQASLIPANSIESIIVIDPNSSDHVSYSRNPRYDARLSVQLLTNQHSAQTIFCGPISRIEDLNLETSITPTADCELIDLKDKREKTGIPLISEVLLDAISESLQNRQSVLISYNAKGVAKRLLCRSCGHIPMCGTCGSQPHVRLDDLVCPVCNTEMWIPKSCPSCKKNTLSSRGIGNKKIATELAKKFPQAKIEIIDKEHSKSSSADIQIVTEHYFQGIYKPFPEKRFGVIAELMADKSLGSDYESTIVTAHRIHRLLHMAHAHKSRCIIQTWMIDVIKPIIESKSFIKSESDLRSKYKLPPFADQFELSGEINQIPEEIRSHCIELQDSPTSHLSTSSRCPEGFEGQGGDSLPVVALQSEVRRGLPLNSIELLRGPRSR